MTEKLRVIHAITALTYGGAQRSLIDFILAYPPWVESRVVSLYPGPMAEQLTAHGIEVIEDNLKGPASLRAIPRWHRLFRKWQPHVVHTHLGKADVCGRLAAWAAGVPVIVTTSWNIEDWKENPILNAIDNATLAPATGVIACSRRVKRFLVRKGLRADRIRVSLGRAELRDRFKSATLEPAREEELRRELRIDKSTLVSLMVGRFYEQKAHDVALEALACVRLPNHILAMAGDGPLRQEMEALAARLGVADRTRFLGNRADVADLLRLADLFVMPSRWEGSPLALGEACAAGLPSLISDIPSMDEVARLGGGSVTVPKDNPAALATAWESLLADDRRRRTLGRRARRRGLRLLDVRTMTEEYLGYYADLWASRPSRLRRLDVPPEFPPMAQPKA